MWLALAAAYILVGGTLAIAWNRVDLAGGVGSARIPSIAVITLGWAPLVGVALGIALFAQWREKRHFARLEREAIRSDPAVVEVPGSVPGEPVGSASARAHASARGHPSAAVVP
jgi:hypothetical protein